MGLVGWVVHKGTCHAGDSRVIPAVTRDRNTFLELPGYIFNININIQLSEYISYDRKYCSTH